MSDESKPELTERALSFHVASAGAVAKDEAAGIGGDPTHLRSLVAGSKEEAAPRMITVGNPRGMLKNFPLRQDDLIVTLCLNLYNVAFGTDAIHQMRGLEVKEKESTDGRKVQAIFHVEKTPANEALQMQAIAALGYIFTQAEDAWELLDQATDVTLDETERKDARRDFIRAALDFGGSFSQDDTGILTHHIAKLLRRVPESETTPGKQAGPAS